MCEGNKWHHDYWGRGEAGGGAIEKFFLVMSGRYDIT